MLKPLCWIPLLVLYLLNRTDSHILVHNKLNAAFINSLPGANASRSLGFLKTANTHDSNGRYDASNGYTFAEGAMLFARKPDAAKPKVKSVKKKEETARKVEPERDPADKTTEGDVTDSYPEELKRALEGFLGPGDKLEDKVQSYIESKASSSFTEMFESSFRPSDTKTIALIHHLKEESADFCDRPYEELGFDSDPSMLRRVRGMFMSGPEGAVEKLVVSLPTARDYVLKYRLRCKFDGDLKKAPNELVALGPGFFTRLYTDKKFPTLPKPAGEPALPLDESHGFMYYLNPATGRNPSDSQPESYRHYDREEVQPLDRQLFDDLFRGCKIHKAQKLDCSNLPERVLRDFMVLFKCAKDLTFFRSALAVLEYLLGRRPSDAEVLFAFATPGTRRAGAESDKRRILELIRYSEVQLDRRFDCFFTPFAEAVVDFFHERMSRQKHFVKMIVTCYNNALAGLKRDLLRMSPYVPGEGAASVFTRLFYSAYEVVRIAAIMENLPFNKTLGALRLAKKAVRLYERLRRLRQTTLARNRAQPIDVKTVGEPEVGGPPVTEGADAVQNELRLYQKFVVETVLIERKFKRRRGDAETTEDMRRNSHRALVDQTVAKILGVTVQRVFDAIAAYRSKSVSPYHRIPKHNRRRARVISNTPRRSVFFGDMATREGVPYYARRDTRHPTYTRTLRRLAVEALDDRVMRLLYMARNDLFVDPVDLDQLLASLGMSARVAEFMLFTAEQLVRQYEVLRIQLRLPPHVVEPRDGPVPGARAALEPAPPAESASDRRNALISWIVPSWVSGEPPPEPPPPRYGRAAALERMRQIRPRMESVSDVVMNYKKHRREYQQVLRRSPLHRLGGFAK